MAVLISLPEPEHIFNMVRSPNKGPRLQVFVANIGIKPTNNN